MPLISSSWSIEERPPFSSRNSMMFSAVTGPMPSISSSCSAVALPSEIGPSPAPAAAAAAAAGDDHLLAVAEPGREVDASLQGAAVEPARALDRVRDTGAERQAVDARAWRPRRRRARRRRGSRRRPARIPRPRSSAPDRRSRRAPRRSGSSGRRTAARRRRSRRRRAAGLGSARACPEAGPEPVAGGASYGAICGRKRAGIASPTMKARSPSGAYTWIRNNIVGLVALFVALSGSAVAFNHSPVHSGETWASKKGKLRPGPTGPAGPQGPQGLQGPAGGGGTHERPRRRRARRHLSQPSDRNRRGAGSGGGTELQPGNQLRYGREPLPRRVRRAGDGWQLQRRGRACRGKAGTPIFPPSRSVARRSRTAPSPMRSSRRRVGFTSAGLTPDCSVNDAWGYLSGGTNVVSHHRDRNGFVHLRGVAMRCGTPPDHTILALPAGHRPVAHELQLGFYQQAGPGLPLAAGRVDIHPSGEVQASSSMPSNSWVSLDGITFRCAPSGSNGCP